jgi:hypothetical protein
MIAERYNSGGHAYDTLWIRDYHTEYPLPDLSTIPRTHDGFYARIHCIYSEYNLEDLLTHDELMPGRGGYIGGDHPIMQIIIDALPDELCDIWYDEGRKVKQSPGHVWELHGDQSQLVYIFRAFTSSIFSRETGGDDDTFDYWPNAVDMSQQMARDLDTMYSNGTTTYYDELRNAYLAYIATHGRVTDFQFDADDIGDDDDDDDDNG